MLFHAIMMTNSSTFKHIRVLSFNCRGFNESKKQYVGSLLPNCDILYLQEHWLSDDQLSCLSTLSSDHIAVGVSGFGNSEVLTGRPYGGCAILWRSSLQLLAEPIVTGSNRVCAVKFMYCDVKFLCICVYMPYESGADNMEEFQFQLAIVDSLLEQHVDCHIILGGDFNVDLGRSWAHTNLLNDFCLHSSMFPVVHHSSSNVDYTYHFNMKHFTCIDHFILSDKLFEEAVVLQYALHDVDNTSDHDPVCMLLDLQVARVQTCKRIYRARPSWSKASAEQLAAYQISLRANLLDINLPYDAILCNDLHCCNADHRAAINTFVSCVGNACLSAASENVPVPRQKGLRGSIPGWTEHVAPFREKSIFWHQVWIDCGRPHNGLVADIMRKTRLQYHAAIRAVRRAETNMVNDRFAEAVSGNKNRNFWQEVKRLRKPCNRVSNVVDGLSSNADIAEVFADKYSALYTDVSYNTDDMSEIRSELNKSIPLQNVGMQSHITTEDVLSAIKMLKPDKNDGNFGLSTNHFINACDELGVYIALMLSSLLVHGMTTDDMNMCTMLPIPKGKNSNLTDSGNYRGIALSSIFGKVFDLIFLSKFSDCLCTSEQQFGFKRQHSTSMCSMVLKETLAYYTVDGGTAFCTFLDATKAFDRVDYCKLFRILLKRNIPYIYLRLLLNLYTSSIASVAWNGVCSRSFCVRNGVRQGGIISPILFCVYIDGLLNQLSESGVGCYIGHIYTGVLAYADDIVLLAPTPSAMRTLLKICEDYGKLYSVVFNAAKSACLQVTKVPRLEATDVEFYIDGKKLASVDKFSHLGHIISAKLDDRDDILRGRNSLCGKVNNVLVYFQQCAPLVKVKLLRSYCSDLYGCTLWDMSHSCVEDVCVAWRKGVRRALGLPNRTHSALLAPVSGFLPLKDELMCRVTSFIANCLCSVNSIVNFVSRYGVFFGLCRSPIGLNARLCCTRLDVPLCNIGVISKRKVRSSLAHAIEFCTTASVICDLLKVKSRFAELPVLASEDIDFIIEDLCTS